MKRYAFAAIAILTLAAASCVPDPTPDANARYLAAAGEPEKAIEILRPLADGGDLFAQYSLGQVYYDLQDYAEAAQWARIAAQRGNPISQYHLGYIFWNGLGGVTKDKIQAYKWLALSADGVQGDRWPKAQKTWDPLWNRTLARFNESARSSFQVRVLAARDALAAQLSIAERADAESLMQAWQPAP